MPPGFSFLDAILVCIPIGLAAMGLIRGAVVEFNSSLGCLVGVAAAWGMGQVPLVASLGQPIGLLVALTVAVIVWRLSRSISANWGQGGHWTTAWGRGLDWVAGLLLGGARGVALVAAACLAYASITAPLGMAAPAGSATFPVFTELALRVVRPVLSDRQQPVTLPKEAAAPPQSAELPASPLITNIAVATPPLSALGLGVAAATRAFLAPPVAAATSPAAFQPDIPVRQVPANLIETHHNLLHLRGTTGRPKHHP